ncbi:peptidase inhibitor family I36 protein [Lentzea sp. NEAU-D7]|uniref:peptidase inhibitor family I36 protein n=1 Tax=Lentzea sp. NEAU-D7 TaxID=2994667 RepID=UPI00224B6AC0|nr:peptidase inhibitor family I36 protein [Lentzea sp. NEAU-D7]MCX2954185.1 peptidase inhibitor family I36 protein [Lentzea sp. NEAU-D7]
MRKALCVLFATVLALMSLLGTASAAPTEIDLSGPAEVGAPAADVSAQALSCGSGNMCAWPVADGSSSRCSWGSADPDWQGGDVRCSWSGSRAVRAVENAGVSTSYTRVCLYPGANYSGSVAYYVLRGAEAPNFPNVLIRSHKWVTGNTCW